MAKKQHLIDFRTTRKPLPDKAYAIVSGCRPDPTDLVSERVWDGIMHLPDDVALMTSSHHGHQLNRLYTLWGDWIEVSARKDDELLLGMLDAADCFQASTFELVHGYYRSAAANLRSAIEVLAIGVLGNLQSNDTDYVRWRKRTLGSLPFSTCIKKIRSLTKAGNAASVLRSNRWADDIYKQLCRYTHSRPDANDGEIWGSNGPIYHPDGVEAVFTLQASTYAACYVLARIGRPSVSVPRSSAFLFKLPGLLCKDEIALSYRSLSRKKGK